MPATAVPVTALVEGLTAIPEDAFTRAAVLEHLREHPVDPDSLAPYLHFRPRVYTRNLIFKNALFELLALCWDVGQVSHIHNHCGQACWMTAPLGRLLVQNYRVVEGSETGAHCLLAPSTQYWMDAASPGAVDPREPIHSVANPAAGARRAVSLHVYSRPYDRCMVYSLRSGAAREIELRYDTRYGREA